MIKIFPHLYLDETEIKITFVKSPGPGGQNVNKLATAAQLRFNVANAASLPEEIRTRVLEKLKDKLTPDGDIVIKASRYRSQERNKFDAIERLVHILQNAMFVPKKRKQTKPTKASKEKRLNDKKLRGERKALRRNKNHT